eukprot:COSAG05_NODE_688_length_7906_cov_24.548098_5_plen_132_part_00
MHAADLVVDLQAAAALHPGLGHAPVCTPQTQHTSGNPYPAIHSHEKKKKKKKKKTTTTTTTKTTTKTRKKKKKTKKTKTKSNNNDDEDEDDDDNTRQQFKEHGAGDSRPAGSPKGVSYRDPSGPGSRVTGP